MLGFRKFDLEIYIIYKRIMMPLWDVLQRFTYMDLVGADVNETRKKNVRMVFKENCIVQFLYPITEKVHYPLIIRAKQGHLGIGERSQFGPNFQHIL